jgi:nitroimidazol reductase NimA-like FMN-containing flavoprotein (pyridoxamine 5'-phosphate oxidase superfamily)
MMTPAYGRLDEVAPADCRQLLGSHHLGRVAVVAGDQPLVFPVNYAVSGNRIVFRSDPGTKLSAAIGKRVAFEIDAFDPQYHEGWSVLVVGTAREETDPARLHDYEQLPLTPWCAGPKAHWIVIEGGAVTGRRLEHEAHD